ncbi:MAG TPA: hypothetical protein VKT75_01480 [Acidobacteriaceae bacterium]|nr:hypothetical protein [Acidobacteriaceae bacterium]
MKLSRRAFSEAAISGTLLSLLAAPEKVDALAAALEDTPDTSTTDASAFWGSFLEKPTHERGLLGHKQPGTDLDRQVNFLHFGEKGLRYADQIDPSELPDYPGDVAVSMNIGGIRLSKADRAKFEQLQSAQLRIDLIQGQQMFNMLDPLAWMAMAAIFPDQSGKLPSLQNLAFDPSTAAQNMQKIVLPGGHGNLAVNVSMVHKESTFFKVINMLVTDAQKVAPVFGFPAISVTALTGFSKLYGVLANRATFLFQARPQPAYTTQESRQKANSSIGINMPSGDYVLVPQSHTDDLKPYMGKLTLNNGYLVPKDGPATSSVYEIAENADPDISYLSMNVSVKPLYQIGEPQEQDSSGGGGGGGGSKGKSGGGAKKGGSSGGGQGGKGGGQKNGTKQGSGG